MHLLFVAEGPACIRCFKYSLLRDSLGQPPTQIQLHRRNFLCTCRIEPVIYLRVNIVLDRFRVGLQAGQLQVLKTGFGDHLRHQFAWILLILQVYLQAITARPIILRAYAIGPLNTYTPEFAGYCP